MKTKLYVERAKGITLKPNDRVNYSEVYQGTFYNTLAALDNSDFLCAEVDNEMLLLIECEYGIQDYNLLDELLESSLH